MSISSGTSIDTRNPWGKRKHRGRWLLVLAVLVFPLALVEHEASLSGTLHDALTLLADTLDEKLDTFNVETDAPIVVTAPTAPDKVESATNIQTQAQPAPKHLELASSKQAAPKQNSPEKKSPVKKAPVKKAPVQVSPEKTVSDWCAALAARLFSVSLRQCQDRGFFDTGYRSVEGRIIAARDIKAKELPSLGRVLVIGGTHGDELTSVSLTFWWLELLEEESDRIDWRVVPAMNPDGVLTRPPQRLNANRVDLNRNLPTPGWAAASREYWREVGRAPRRYPGENPASEPETRWLMHEVESYAPDVIVALHAPYGVLDYDGEFPPPPKLGELALQRLGVFPGSLGNYGSRFLGIPVITVELDHATRMPAREQANAMWRDLKIWLNRYLSTSRQVELEEKPANG